MQLLNDHQDEARLARRLTAIKTDIPLTVEKDQLKPGGASVADLERFFDRLGFGGRLREQALDIVCPS